MSAKILVTGNNGYIGSVLVQELLKKDYEVIGMDTNYYGDNYNDIPQINRDIRKVRKSDIRDIDCIIHLAALSNDPLCKLNPKLTMDINHKATIKLAGLAKTCKVKRFIYASSQSMYGKSNSEKELTETGPKNAVTPYGESKWKSEKGLRKLKSSNFTTICFRPSTVFGWSPNLRADIIFNDLICSGYTTNKIEVKSDGTPWRPVIHIQDVCNAFIAGIEVPKEIVSGQSYNVGVDGRNYQVKDLALAAKKLLPNAEIVYTGKHGYDFRNYKISFDKILHDLKGYYKPSWDLMRGGTDLIEHLQKFVFNKKSYMGTKYNRINKLKYLLENNELNEELYWK